jgi:hypothetical protein
MKRLILILFMLPLMSVTALCQQGLNISKVFDGRYSKKDFAEEATVSGSFILGEDINLYRAITVNNAEATEFIRSQVLKDGLAAKRKEVSMRAGKLAYGIYQMPPAKGKTRKRYIFFYENNGKGALIYMEGDATLKEIKHAIMNK